MGQFLAHRPRVADISVDSSCAGVFRNEHERIISSLHDNEFVDLLRCAVEHAPGAVELQEHQAAKAEAYKLQTTLLERDAALQRKDVEVRNLF